MTWNNLPLAGKAICVIVALIGIIATYDMLKNVFTKETETFVEEENQ